MSANAKSINTVAIKKSTTNVANFFQKKFSIKQKYYAKHVVMRCQLNHDHKLSNLTRGDFSCLRKQELFWPDGRFAHQIS